MKAPAIPAAVEWRNGMVLEPAQFLQTDSRAATLAHMAALVAEPWPWGFGLVNVDQTALASGQLRIDCEGVFPSGTPFPRRQLTVTLPEGEDGDHRTYQVVMADDHAIALSAGEGAPADHVLPVSRLVFRSGVWSELPDWSPPTYLLGPDHPMRLDMTRQLGALAALAAGFMTTLRLPRAENRPAAHVLGNVAAQLVQGVGVMEALLAAPTVSPGRLGIEAVRLALGVRAAAGDFERLDAGWDPADQRGSMRRMLYATESAASGIGLPFRASPFRTLDGGDTLLVEGIPGAAVLLAIEASRPGDLIAARTWFEGAALAAPDRLQEAFSLRVAGCPRYPLERDPRTGVASGPLLALYQVENDATWRGDGGSLALGAKTRPPANSSFSIFVPEDPEAETIPVNGFSNTAVGRHGSTAASPASAGTFASPSWAGATAPGGK